MDEKKYTIKDFIYWIEKYIDMDEKYSVGQIANIIGKAMVNFFEDSNTSF